MKNLARIFLMVSLLGLGTEGKAETLTASPPARSSLEIYDLGYAWITELCRVAISRGEHDIVFEDLPGSFVSGSSALLSSGRSSGLNILEQRYQYSLENEARLLDAFRGQSVEVTRSGDRFSGQVLHAEAQDQADTLDVLLLEDGQPRWVRGAQSIKLLAQDRSWAPEPRLIWRVDSGIDQAASLRLIYEAEDFDWNASYSLVLDPDNRQASLSGTVGLENRSSRSFPDARVTLVRTEQGQTGPLIDQKKKGASRRLRYSESGGELQFEQQIHGPGSVARFPLPNPVNLEARSRVFTTLVDIPEMPVEMTYVYDGVQFDRFQQNRRNDWNYGTESHPAVDIYLSYENLKRFKVEKDLPGGKLRVFERGTDGGLLLMADEMVNSLPHQGVGLIRVGSSPSLAGTRVRIGYSEITPLHEYEESFQIGLENFGDHEVTVKVVEHLYRWPEYEIVKSDSEYEEEGPQKISFKVLLKPGGSRSIHYSVRYRW